MSSENEWEEIPGEDNVEIWDFAIDKEFVGFYVSTKTNVGPHNSTLYTFKQENEELIGIWGTAVLDTRFQNLQPNDKVRIVYGGKVKNEKGNNYHDYKVFKSKKQEATKPLPEKEKVENVKEGDIDIKDIPF